LTGVLNRQALMEAGAHELKRAQRYKRDLAVLVMKLDYFKGTDDTHGFSDEIVRQLISVVRNTTRDSDFIGRVGDVEFAIILPETSKGNAMTVAERIKENIQADNLKNKVNYFITTAFGVAEKTSKSDTIDSLLLKALNATQEKKGNTVSKKPKKQSKKGA